MTKFTFDESGKIIQPSAEELAAADEEIDIITYTKFTTLDGSPYYAFLAVKPSKYKEYSDMVVSKQPMNLSDYGKILASGYAAKPPDEVIEEMHERYGYLEKYEGKLVEEAKKQQKVFHDKKEATKLLDIVALLKKPQ